MAFGRKKEKPLNRILMVIDFENILHNVREEISPERYSIEEGFNKIIKTIAEEIGGIIKIFAFVPSNRALVWDKELARLGFSITLCPALKDKQGIERDSTDARLIEDTEWFMDNIQGLTHICLASGDKDFSALLKKAALKGLKRIIVAGNLRSLSHDLIRLADKKPGGKEKMVYIFSPTANGK